MLGGDIGYYYSGECTIAGGKLKGTVNVIRYDQNSISVFGDADNFTLQLDGTINGYTLAANAKSDKYPQYGITVTGTKKEDL
jgi:hypothetical protein